MFSGKIQYLSFFLKQFFVFNFFNLAHLAGQELLMEKRMVGANMGDQAYRVQNRQLVNQYFNQLQ